MTKLVQVLGRNLEFMVTRAQEFKEQWKDQYVSIEHLVLAYVDDPRFGQRTLASEGLDHEKLAQAIKEIRGNNAVTDKVKVSTTHTLTPKPTRLFCLYEVEGNLGDASRQISA